MATFITAPVQGMETALGASSNLLTWTGASDAADAKANYIFSDDSILASANPPDKLVALSELEWSTVRTADGSGGGNFVFDSSPYIRVYFCERLSEDWSSTNRVTFKDTIANIITDLIANFEANGWRIFRAAKIEFSDIFSMRWVDEDGHGYQYAIDVFMGVED